MLQFQTVAFKIPKYQEQKIKKQKKKYWLYYTNRQQFVQINEFKSRFIKITYGVPQGSVLGPIIIIKCIKHIERLKNTQICSLLWLHFLFSLPLISSISEWDWEGRSARKHLTYLHYIVKAGLNHNCSLEF